MFVMELRRLCNDLAWCHRTVFGLTVFKFDDFSGILLLRHAAMLSNFIRNCTHRSGAVFFSERVINVRNQLPDSTDFRSLSLFMHSVCCTDLSCHLRLLLPPPKNEVMFLVRSVCLFVCLSVCLSVRRITRKLVNGFLTKFFGGVGHGSRTKWYNFGGDPDHASDPGVQSPKSGSSVSAEVCALWVLLVLVCIVCVRVRVRVCVHGL